MAYLVEPVNFDDLSPEGRGRVVPARTRKGSRKGRRAHLDGVGKAPKSSH